MTENYRPEKVHNVRITVEGTVTHLSSDGRIIGLSTPRRVVGSAGNVYIDLDAPGVTVERLPDPEPTWEPGQAVRSACGGTYLRTNQGTWRSMDGEEFAHHAISRPLTRLVPEGGER